ncbi:Lrp/AsnC family transcriptional regulator [Nanoarchaeota archaeon]
MEDIKGIGKIVAQDYTVKLDKINSRLLSLLMSNARLQHSTLAKVLKISKSNVLRRINLLEEKHIITGYHAFIDVDKIGLKACLLFIQTKCTEQQRIRYVKKISEHPWVYGNIDITGKYNIMAAFYYKDSEQRDKLVENLLVPEHVKDFQTFNVKTEFPRLDYTTEMFPEEKSQVLRKDASFSKLFAKKKEKRNIDNVDIKLLGILANNCRMSLTEMGEKLKISRETISYRIKKLITVGAIAKFQPAVNLFLLGFDAYLLMIKLAKPTQKRQIINYLKATHRCNTILTSDGGWDLMTIVHFKSNKEFRKLETDMLLKFKDAVYEYSFEVMKHQEKLDWLPKTVVDDLKKRI